MDNFEQELAKNLLAAWLATQQGIGLSYARKKVDETPGEVGEFWLHLARQIISARDKKASELL